MHKNNRVLIIEDDGLLAARYEAAFGAEGFEVTLLTDAQSVLSEVDAVENVPAFILLDEAMPGVQPLELVQRIKRSPELQSVPILVNNMASQSKVRDVVRTVMACLNPANDEAIV